MASLPTPSFGRCKTLGLLAVALAAALFTGMAKKSPITIRFFTEAKQQDTDRFAKPLTFHNPTREGYIEKTPTIHERFVKAVYPFQAPDGTWGCAFQLDNSGRINLEVLSTERRGSSLVAFVGTKNGVHQVVELLIDKPIRDGLISIPSGLTELEIAAITKEWPAIGRRKKVES